MLRRDIHSSEVMVMKRYLAPVGWAVGMGLLILDGQTAVSGASDGIELCIHTLIPSLFPFFLMSAMLTGSLPGGGLLAAGILGGYPVGAGNTARAFRDGMLTPAEAARMAVLCNCAGPSFIFGVTAPVLGGLRAGVMLWCVYLSSVLALRAVLPGIAPICGTSRTVRLQQALWESIRAMAGVCGWVIMFRVVMAVLDRWVLWLLPDWGRAAVYGILELSNACLALEAVEPGLRFVLAAGFIGFGGLCVCLQTAHVAQGISLKLYFPGKLFQAAVCMLLASLVMPGSVEPAVQVIFLAAAVFFGWILRKCEKRCGNPRQVVV